MTTDPAQKIKINAQALLKYRRRKWNPDAVFKGFLAAISFVILLIIGAILVQLVRSSSLTLHQFGFHFITGKVWDPYSQEFGALPFIYGTLMTSFLALFMAVPLSLGTALFLSEWAPAWFRKIISFVIELLAAIPSVIYGLWGIFVLIPFLRETVVPHLFLPLNSVSLFKGPFFGPSLLSGSLILTIMILPTITSISKEIFLSVPQEMREAVFALGGTRWESIRLVVLRMSKSGILGAIILGLGRAIGETMAVTMLIGNRPEISISILAPSHSLSSVIASEFAEATTPLYLSALAEVGLLLVIVTLIINGFARLLVRREMRGAR